MRRKYIEATKELTYSRKESFLVPRRTMDTERLGRRCPDIGRYVQDLLRYKKDGTVEVLRWIPEVPSKLGERVR